VRAGGAIPPGYSAKREVKAGKSENRELPRDLAAFGTDSGTLIVGVGEDTNGSLRRRFAMPAMHVPGVQ
jgi:hypothetical protein